jgi:acid phosphatase
MKRFVLCCLILLAALFLAACSRGDRGPVANVAATLAALPTPSAGDPPAAIPEFDHIVFIILENRNYERVIGSDQMPYLNALADRYALLDNYFAVRHPSLPNYIALISGDTHGINRDCTGCFINAASLPDLIEAAGREWKSYQEDMPLPCQLGNVGDYAQRHNPFVYFDPIRTNPLRCAGHVVNLAELWIDLDLTLPDFVFITPNLCNDGHDCPLSTVDAWLEENIARLVEHPKLAENSLIVITFDEAESLNAGTCCGLGVSGGGRVPAILISDRVRPGFVDSTPLTHYSLLKTVELAWGLPALGKTADPQVTAIIAPWIDASGTPK